MQSWLYSALDKPDRKTLSLEVEMGVLLGFIGILSLFLVWIINPFEKRHPCPLCGARMLDGTHCPCEQSHGRMLKW